MTASRCLTSGALEAGYSIRTRAIERGKNMPKKTIWQLHHVTYNPERVVICTRAEHYYLSRLNFFKSLSDGFREAMLALMANKPTREKE